MKKSFASKFWAATTLLAFSAVISGLSCIPTNAATASNANLISQGKSLTSQFGCTGCHGSDLKGKMGPSITASGILKTYNKTTFERAMNVGLNPKGGPLQPPMPTFHMPKPKADAVYAYLKSIK